MNFIENDRRLNINNKKEIKKEKKVTFLYSLFFYRGL